MLKIEYDEKQIIDNLYNEIKNIILSKKDNKTYNYNFKQHHLYEEEQYPGISKNYFNESGSVEFKNINNQTIKLQINRWHPHKHNGCSGLNPNPCLSAVIYIIENNESQIFWELNVKSGTLYYNAQVSNLEIPCYILKEKKDNLNDIVNDTNEQENQIFKNKIKPQEKRIIFDEIEYIYDRYKSAEKDREELLLKRKNDIEKATNEIIKSFAQIITTSEKDILCVQEELKTFDKLLTKYSTFSVDLIGNILQQLISIVEADGYLYKQINYISKKRVHSALDFWDEDIQALANIIIITEKYIEYYENSSQTEIKIDKLIEQGYALLLSQQDKNIKDDKIITLYSLQEGHAICNINFGKFDYAKDFIDNLIQYRFQNKMDEFTEKDMLLFLQNYIIQHKDEIMKKYESKFDIKILEL